MGYRDENKHIAGTIYRFIANIISAYQDDPSALDSFQNYLDRLKTDDRNLVVLIEDSYKIIEGIREGNFNKALHYLDLIKARDICRLVREVVTVYKTKGRWHKDTKKSLKSLEITLETLKTVESKTEWFLRLVRDCRMIYDGLVINNLARVIYALDSIEKTINQV